MHHLLLSWTYADQEVALNEGWGVFDNSDHGLRIERDDGSQRFSSDCDAIAYVEQRAERGNALALAALAFIAQTIVEK